MADTDTQQPLFGAPATSPASLANRRALALELMKQGMSTDPIRSRWQGVGRIAQALAGGYEASQSDKAEQTARAQLLSDVMNARNSGDPAKMLGTALNPFAPEKPAAEMAGKSFPGMLDTGLYAQPFNPATGRPSAPAIDKQVVTHQGAEGVQAPAVVTPQDIPPGAGGLANPPRVNGQDQNFTGPIIPPGGFNAARRQPPAAPPLQRPTPPQPPQPDESPGNFNQRFGAAYPRSIPELAAMGRDIKSAGAQREGQNEVIKQDMAGAQSAPDQLVQLNLIENLARAAPPVTGLVGEPLLKLKQTINGLAGKDILGDTLAAETMRKANVFLAGEASKALSARGATNADFAAMLNAQPGNLMTSNEGTLILTGILKEIQRQKLELGNKASTTQDYAGWMNTRTQYFDEHPIINPFNNTPMGTSRDTPKQQNTSDQRGEKIIDGRRYKSLGNGRWQEVQ